MTLLLRDYEETRTQKQKTRRNNRGNSVMVTRIKGQQITVNLKGREAKDDVIIERIRRRMDAETDDRRE